MTDKRFKTYIRHLLENNTNPDVRITWEGAEPARMGLDFFRRALEFVAEYQKPGQRILHSLEANDAVLDDEWCAFFREHGFRITLRVDGPGPMHDRHRLTMGRRRNFEQVMRNWEALRRQDAEILIHCTVHAANANHPIEVYRFFRDELHARFMEFIPGVEQAAGAREFGQFLIAIFEDWVKSDPGRVSVQAFDAVLGGWLRQDSQALPDSVYTGYQLFVDHSAPKMKALADLIRQRNRPGEQPVLA